jgi:hypothetical protein
MICSYAISAFSRGPLNGMVVIVKALMALCGLDDVDAESAPHAKNLSFIKGTITLPPC